MKRLLLFPICWWITLFSFAQEDTSDVEAVRRMVNLTEVIVRSDLNVPKFLQRIKYDTTYYKAFKNLHVLGFTALNFIQMYDKNGKPKATLQSKTRQNVQNGCRTMDVLEEKTSGDFYDYHHEYNYYTAELYAAFFFTKGKVCGENNIVKGVEHHVRNKRGLEKNKEQLKMLFFNPGKKIPGVPFFGDKLDVFNEEVARNYDFLIDTSELNGQPCYVFSIKAKEGLTSSERDAIVFDNITTWFNQKTLEIVGRKYDMSYGAGIYDFDVHMEVQMTKVGEYLVPHVLRYKGNWFLVTKKRERGIFTATLYDFKKS
ncbi:MAG: hypothetical protein ICV66_02915 [Chitinophagaceae bacterium]|nr:hypothetical protein [Chitinophagaceae bacterium]